MNLRVAGGQLTLGSVFKLFAVGWICAWAALFVIVFGMLLLIVAISGTMVIDGEVVHGRGVALVQMLPLLVIFPIVIGLQSLIFGAFLTGGVWLYRLRRPLTLVTE